MSIITVAHKCKSLGSSEMEFESLAAMKSDELAPHLILSIEVKDKKSIQRILEVFESNIRTIKTVKPMGYKIADKITWIGDDAKFIFANKKYL